MELTGACLTWERDVMAARFAGSRSLDERRRRRLAQESQELATTDAKNLAEQARLVEARIRQFPLRKAISHRGWKLWAVAILALAPVAAIIYGAVLEVISPEKVYAELRPWLDAHSGLAPLLVGGLCLAAAQLAWLTWWMRSQSLNDFGGRYRVWVRAAALLFVVGVCAATDAHAIAGRLVSQQIEIEFPHREVLCWLIPLAIPVCVVFRGLQRDMKGCRGSRAMLWLTAIGAMTATAFTLLSHRINWRPELHPVIVVGGVLVSAWAVFFSTLLHARHVLHFSAEAPPETLTLWQRFVQSLSRPRSEDDETDARNPEKAKQPAADKETKTPAKTSSKAAKPAAKKAAPKRAAKSTTSKRSKETKPAATQVKAAPQPTPQPAAQAEPKAAPSKPQEQKPATQNAKASAPRNEGPTLDKDALKGLSKRERRKLRKQAREEQRRTQMRDAA